jgi:hypothetical protein
VDYWADKPSSGKTLANVTTIDLSNPLMTNGVYVVNGTGAKLTITNSGAVPNGKRITIYVEGDVAITKDITYDMSNPWNSTSDIPVFKLVAKGNIFIGSNVKEIDGNIIAVPDAGYEKLTNRNDYTPKLKGTISTCSTGFNIISPSDPTILAKCSKNLAFYGTVAANQIYLLRTYGSMNNGTPAEQFNLSPEVWLAPDSNDSIDPAYKSIVGLPPVL